MPDQKFENPKLVSIYDDFDGERTDLEYYLNIARELKASSVLDVGSGTGCFAGLLTQNGFDVIGLEPAEASIAFAQKKPFAEKVRWILGDSSSLPPLAVDLAVMTGNVAQIFVTDQSWRENLNCLRRAIKPEGYLVFEVRDPSKKDWLNWNRENTYQKLTTPKFGKVEAWCEVTDTSDELVSFCWTYIFEDGEKLASHSTLRFRNREDICISLEEADYEVKDIRDAPDRPGKEFVFIAKVR